MADQEIEQLKELVRQNIALSQETNKILRRMHRSAQWKSFAWWAFVALSVGLTIWSYYTFVAPRVEQITNVYNTNIGEAQSLWQMATDFFKTTPPATSTTQ